MMWLAWALIGVAIAAAAFVFLMIYWDFKTFMDDGEDR